MANKSLDIHLQLGQTLIDLKHLLSRSAIGEPCMLYISELSALHIPSRPENEAIGANVGVETGMLPNSLGIFYVPKLLRR